MIDEYVAFLALVRAGQGGGSSGLGGDFQLISTSQAISVSPFVVTWLAVDTTAAPVTLTFPSAAQSVNALVVIVDRFNTSSKNPIGIACPMGVQCWNFQNPGTYAQNVAIADPSGNPTRLKFSASLSEWLSW